MAVLKPRKEEREAERQEENKDKVVQGVLMQGPGKFHMSSSKCISGQARLLRPENVQSPCACACKNSKNKGWALQLFNSPPYFAELPHAEIANDV